MFWNDFPVNFNCPIWSSNVFLLLLLCAGCGDRAWCLTFICAHPSPNPINLASFFIPTMPQPQHRTKKNVFSANEVPRVHKVRIGDSDHVICLLLCGDYVWKPRTVDSDALAPSRVCVWLLCFLKIVESDDFIFLHLCVSQLGKLRKVGSYARISFHVYVGHAWNLGIVDADDAISCPMCLACLKTKDGGCRWCDSLTFICAYLSPDPINLAPASSPSISHTHPHDAPADNVKAELHFQKLHFAFTGCGYFDYLIGLHLCVNCQESRNGRVWSCHMLTVICFPCSKTTDTGFMWFDILLPV